MVQIGSTRKCRIRWGGSGSSVHSPDVSLLPLVFFIISGGRIGNGVHNKHQTTDTVNSACEWNLRRLISALTKLQARAVLCSPGSCRLGMFIPFNRYSYEYLNLLLDPRLFVAPILHVASNCENFNFDGPSSFDLLSDFRLQ